MHTLKIAVAVAITAMVCGGAGAQTPGDGMADFYYFASDGTVTTSFGEVFRPAGTMLVDTDGEDVVFMDISGPNVANDGCYFCDAMNLPGADAQGDASPWSVGYSGGATQWIRIDPLDGRGFVGVISVGFMDGDEVDHLWPANGSSFDFPEGGTGLATYEAGLGAAAFPKRYSLNGTPEFNVRYASEFGATSFTNVFIVPEPGAMGLVLLGVLGMLTRATRR